MLKILWCESMRMILDNYIILEFEILFNNLIFYLFN